MKRFKRILSSIFLIITLLVNTVYADAVVLSSAPTNTSTVNNGVAGSNILATTVYSNLYSGPAAVPTDGTVVAYTSSGTGSVTYTSPVTKTISSPAANMQSQSSSTSGVIDNIGFSKSSSSSSTNVTYDSPVTKTITSPSAEGSLTSSNATTGPGAITSTSQNAPGTSGQTTTRTTTTTAASTVNTGGSILYSVNANITTAKPTISATGAIVVDATTKQILFYKNPYTPYAPASLTNMMTAYLLLRYKGLNDVLTVSQRAVTNVESDASVAGLKAGDTIVVKDAIAAMFVRNCCDVANVAAEAVSGSIENFVSLMNQTAKSWGCVSTNFTNPSGLHNDGHLSSPYDMAVIMDKVTSDASLLYIMTLTKYTLPATAHRRALTLTTKNTLTTSGSSNFYSGAQASRMGYTSKARYNIATLMPYNNHRIIAIVMHANGSQFSDTKKLLNFAQKAVAETITNGTANTGLTAAITQQALQQQMLVAQQAAQNTANTGVVVQTENRASTTNTAQSAISNALMSVQLITAATGLTSETAGTWASDANGWYFIKSDGTKAVNQWIQTNQKIFCVDANGYMIKGFKDFSNGKRYYFDTATGELKYNTWINDATGGYYLQADGSLARASAGTTMNITTSVGVYTIDSNGKAIAKVS